MKIALVIPGGVDRSGEYRVIPALLALLRQLARDHEVHVFARRQEPEPGKWQLAGATIHNVGPDPFLLRILADIRREHRRGRFALVQSIWSGNSGVAALMAARLLGLPCLVHVAGGELAALPDIGYGGQLHAWSRMVERVVLRHANRVTAASGPILAQLHQLGVEGEAVPLGVDVDAWPVRAPVRREARQPLRLIQVASLNRVKDQSTLLRAMARLQALDLPVTLDLVGVDTLGGALQRLAAQLGVAGRVRFHDFLPHRAARERVAAADLYVVSSRHEAGPLAMLEAAVVGLPTVGTAVGHVVDWAPHAALCVPTGDDAALAGAIAVIVGDEDYRLRLAHEAQARALAADARFTAQRFCSLYQRLAPQA